MLVKENLKSCNRKKNIFINFGFGQTPPRPPYSPALPPDLTFWAGKLLVAVGFPAPFMLFCIFSGLHPLIFSILLLTSIESLFVAPWTVAHQASPSMGFPRQEYWSGLSFSSSIDLPDPEIESVCLALAGEFFTTEPLGIPDDAILSGSSL